MKKVILASFLALAACDHAPYFTQECMAYADDGWHSVPYTAYHHIITTVSDSKGRTHTTTRSIPYTAFHMVHSQHCIQYAQVCHPGRKDGKDIPCGR